MPDSSIAIIGLPFDEFSSFMRGPKKGPDKIREIFHNGSMNYFTESGIDLEPILKDLGNIEPIDHPQSIVAELEQKVKSMKTIALGGDHSLSYATIKAHALNYSDLNVLHLDAHPDLHDEYDGNKFSHACPFARIMEEGLIKKLVQVGIRTLSAHQREQAERFNVEIIEMKGFDPLQKVNLDGPVFLSLDIDVFDPAFTPGISHHEPGGMSVREALTFLSNQDLNLVGADIMEYNPERDVHYVTAAVCVKLLKEIAGLMLV